MRLASHCRVVVLVDWLYMKYIVQKKHGYSTPYPPKIAEMTEKTSKYHDVDTYNVEEFKCTYVPAERKAIFEFADGLYIDKENVEIKNVDITDGFDELKITINNADFVVSLEEGTLKFKPFA